MLLLRGLCCKGGRIESAVFQFGLFELPIFYFENIRFGERFPASQMFAELNDFRGVSRDVDYRLAFFLITAEGKYSLAGPNSPPRCGV